jgi:hypothetical protein
MSDPKTRPTRASVPKFIKSVAHEGRRADCAKVVEMMQEITGEKPCMWGPSIIGFGEYHYEYASGREGDWPLTGVSPRKTSLVLYIMSGFKQYDELMARLGKHKTGASCLYINKLEDVHLPTLKKLIRQSVAHTKKTHTS